MVCDKIKIQCVIAQNVEEKYFSLVNKFFLNISANPNFASKDKRGFQKRTKLIIMALLPTIYSHLLAIYFFLCTI